MRPWAGDDARVGLDQIGEPLERADAAAQPGAVAVVEQRPLLRRHDAAGHQQVQLRKVHDRYRRRCARRACSRSRSAAPANSIEPSPRVGLRRPGGLGQRAPAAGERHRRRRCCSGSVFVFSCAKMTPPPRPTASLAPTCSGCQCVLISVWMRLLPVAVLTAASSASAFAARPPSIISAPVRARQRNHVAAGTLEQRRAAEIGGGDACERPARAEAQA